MRIRHVKGSEEYVAGSPLVIQKPEDFRGRYKEAVFGTEAPIRLEIGMGMGTFIRELSRREPDISFIGFELNRGAAHITSTHEADLVTGKSMQRVRHGRFAQRTASDHPVATATVREKVRHVFGERVIHSIGRLTGFFSRFKHTAILFPVVVNTVLKNF